MKAFYKTSFTQPDSGTFGELPEPVVSPNQLLIEVKAVSINPIDYKLNKGNTRFLPHARLPKIVGSDFAGIVGQAAEGDSRFKVGDRIYGAVPIFLGKAGALVELLVTDPVNARHIPAGMSFEQAASLPIAALTALNGLRRCGVKAGTKLLINGATGGVGHFATQIAAAKGAVITASCSDVNKALAKQLGAQNTVGYRKEELAGLTGSFDAILDAWGQMKYSDYAPLLKSGGTYASPLILWAPAFFTKLAFWFTGRKITSSNMRKRPEDYAEIEKLFFEKKLTPMIEKTFPLEQAAAAFEYAENGKPRGKVIVTL